jgi:hypothetical protein
MALLFAPMVHAHRFLFPRLKRVSPYVKGNLLAEARRLNRAGYHTAAVATARAALERRLKEIAFARAEWTRPKGNPGLSALTRFLFSLGCFNVRTKCLIDSFAVKANSACHGNPVSRRSARNIIWRAAQVMAMLEGSAA